MVEGCKSNREEERDSEEEIWKISKMKLGWTLLLMLLLSSFFLDPSQKAWQFRRKSLYLSFSCFSPKGCESCKPSTAPCYRNGRFSYLLHGMYNNFPFQETQILSCKLILHDIFSRRLSCIHHHLCTLALQRFGYEKLDFPSRMVLWCWKLGGEWTVLFQTGISYPKHSFQLIIFAFFLLEKQIRLSEKCLCSSQWSFSCLLDLLFIARNKAWVLLAENLKTMISKKFSFCSPLSQNLTDNETFPYFSPFAEFLWYFVYVQQRQLKLRTPHW